MTVRNRHRSKRSRQLASGVIASAIARNPTGVLFLMCLFLFALTGAYWHVNSIDFHFKNFSFGNSQASVLTEEMQRSLRDRHVNRKFVMGGVQLGMTAEMVKTIHPNAQQGLDRNGEPVMIIPTSQGMMVAWLFDHDEYVVVDGKKVHDTAVRVYRLRLDEAFDTLTEQDIMDRYAREYGRPIEASCTRAGIGDTPRCTYSWWGGDGIELQAIAKVKADLNGKDYTQLTTIATNTIKVSKIQAVSLSQASIAHRWGYIN